MRGAAGRGWRLRACAVGRGGGGGGLPPFAPPAGLSLAGQGRAAERYGLRRAGRSLA